MPDTVAGTGTDGAIRRTADGAPGTGAGVGRRGVLAASAAAGLTLLTGCGDAPSPGSSDAKPAPRPSHTSPGPSARHSTPAPARTPRRPRPELPRGGRKLFPRYRMVGFCGLPGAAALGRLGTGDPAGRADEIEKTARRYGAGREPLPVLELLAVVANSTPGPDGAYRSRTPAATIDRFHRLARRRRAMLLLNVQPGRAAVLDEVKALRKWLVHPDVGVALDPEWEMGPGEVPGDSYGRTDGHELTSVARYLSGLVAAHDLPEKPLVFHQVATSVVREQSALRPQPGVALVKSADGIGSPGLKRGTWKRLVRDLPDGVHTGFKLFYDEDAQGGGRLMTPKEVLALRPQPEYVMYE
ncbi:hypothetical protein AB0G35_14520 [Streptomyces sp. NPDC021749]|uniref:hypothetical protein n=1 Tax=Streptomyces sp. NPDC021749 TaxID=3154905 RepID=UPI0033FB618B